jgi:hypothetical protein
MFSQKENTHIAPSPQITNIFENNPLIQQSFGYNHLSAIHDISYPLVISKKFTNKDKSDIPHHLTSTYSGYYIQQISGMQINKKEDILTGYFIFVSLFNAIFSFNKGAKMNDFLNTSQTVQASST